MQVAHVDLSLIRNAFQFRLILEREAVAAFTRERERRGDRGAARRRIEAIVERRATTASTRR